MLQKNGDYMVPVKEVTIGPASKFFKANELETIKTIVHKFDNSESQLSIYIPSLELGDTRYPEPTPQDYLQSKESNILYQNGTTPTEGNNNDPGVPVGVIIDDPNAPLLPSYPGFVIDPDGNLAYYQEVTEEMAWHNDVWIMGYQEVLSPESERISDLDLADPYSGIHPSRVNGEMERVGYIRVTNGNLGRIEPWVKGKLEMQIIVFNEAGREILNQKFGKTRRWRFMSEKWVEYDKELGAWNIPNIGNVTYEKWIEENSGDEITYTISTPAQNGFPSTSVSYKRKEYSNDLGIGMVQFTDPKSTIYNSISYINFRRK
jgi:hypothetical protein